MSVTITTPAVGYTGRSQLGGGITLDFADGTAVYDGELSDGVRAYLYSAGYTVDGQQVTQPVAEQPDSRDVGDEQVGTKLRDAAVDPAPGDFLPPLNAGQGDPHGPDVVSPGIHGLEGVRPIKPGDVHVVVQSDLDELPEGMSGVLVPADADQEQIEVAAKAQNDAETDHLEHVLEHGVTDAQVAAVRPAGNASTADWRAYVLTLGPSPEDVDGLSRSDLQAEADKRQQPADAEPDA